MDQTLRKRYKVGLFFRHAFIKDTPDGLQLNRSKLTKFFDSFELRICQVNIESNTIYLTFDSKIYPAPFNIISLYNLERTLNRFPYIADASVNAFSYSVKLEFTRPIQWQPR